MKRLALVLPLWLACATTRPPALDEVAELRREALGKPPGGGPAVDLGHLDPATFDIPIEVTPEVAAWAAYWAGDGCHWFAGWVERAAVRRPMLERALAAEGLPRDLAALPMIESGLLPGPTSSSGAVGEWQLRDTTARALGLRVEPGLDERRDPDRAAAAGARYLAQLVRRFPNPLLAWAAYNAGPEAMRQAMAAGHSDDFWVLARGGHLSAETANYVPKLIAAAILSRDPARYGISRCGAR